LSEVRNMPAGCRVIVVAPGGEPLRTTFAVRVRPG
jgi:hypothetical protein